MTEEVTFELMPIEALLAHEQVLPDHVVELVDKLVESGVFVEPVWIARGSHVILNGHHRVAALRRLGAERIAAWVIDYDSDIVQLERWTPGPPLSKEEVVRRARTGELFPPQTTRHVLTAELPPRPTLLRDLLPANGHAAVAGRSRRPGAPRASRSRSPPPG
jgi:L-serine kinase (ADP)